jgi:hypothetical protein
MKKKILSIALAGLLVFTGTSCGEFGDINIDPNNTTSVAPETLLASALRQIGDGALLGADIPILYVQHMSETQYTESSLYQDVNFNFNGWYTGPLADLQHIIELNTDEETKEDALQSGSNANQIAAARILRAYFFHFMTDRWGALPYTQALQGRENFTPAYDSQETIYKDLLKELKEAVAQIDGGAGVDGDFIFDGDMEEWKKFANTIRLIMAIRMSEVDEALANTEFNSALNAGILDSDLMYPYLAETNNQNPWFGRFITRNDYSISKILADTLRTLGDPRLDSYGDPAPNFGDVRGEPYGLLNGGSVPDADVSFPNSTYVRAQDAPIAVITTAQTFFYRAEAAKRGWTSENAQEMYEAGIAASWEQWGVFDQAAYDAYLLDPHVAYDDANALEQIGFQKWLAFYLQGYEAWAEWRRTGFPSLSPPPDAMNDSGEIPVRHAYPVTERDINSTNYEAAVAAQGPDELDTNLWWDK